MEENREINEIWESIYFLRTILYQNFLIYQNHSEIRYVLLSASAEKIRYIRNYAKFPSNA